MAFTGVTYAHGPPVHPSQQHEVLFVHLAQFDVEDVGELLLELIGEPLCSSSFGRIEDADDGPAVDLLAEQPDGKPDGDAHALHAENSRLPFVGKAISLPKHILQIKDSFKRSEGEIIAG